MAIFLWSNVNSKSNLGTDSKSYPSIFYCLDFVPAVPCQNIRANTDIFEISSQVNPELDKKNTKIQKKLSSYIFYLQKSSHHATFKIPSRHLCQTNIRKPSLNTHTYQATRRLPVNQSPLTQQPTNPICQS